MDKTFKYSEEVEEALHSGRAVVALESTIIAHGLPHPLNVETAARMEQAVRRSGAVPATIAVIDGQCYIGLSEGRMDTIARGHNVLKLATRDLPRAIHSRLTGATTVSATMWLAARAGIRVFATGGIGGVHRGAEHTWDVSADLWELSRTPVAVVCSGAKAILDIPKTLEYLETLAVPVIGLGTNEFPAFYSRSSGCRLEASVNSPAEAASFLRTAWQSGLNCGVLVANPIPVPDELPASEMETHIHAALEAAQLEGVEGKALTPWLLNHLAEATGGRTLAANTALAVNNAHVAGQIAAAL